MWKSRNLAASLSHWPDSGTRRYRWRTLTRRGGQTSRPWRTRSPSSPRAWSSWDSCSWSWRWAGRWPDGTPWSACCWGYPRSWSSWCGPPWAGSWPGTRRWWRPSPRGGSCARSAWSRPAVGWSRWTSCLSSKPANANIIIFHQLLCETNFLKIATTTNWQNWVRVSQLWLLPITWGGCFSMTKELLTSWSSNTLRPSESSGRMFMLVSWLGMLSPSWIISSCRICCRLIQIISAKSSHLREYNCDTWHSSLGAWCDCETDSSFWDTWLWSVILWCDCNNCSDVMDQWGAGLSCKGNAWKCHDYRATTS